MAPCQTSGPQAGQNRCGCARSPNARRRVEVSVYLDASVLVALLTVEPLSGRADNFIASTREPLIVSDFASAEFSSAIARRVRMRETTRAEARADLADFDLWTMRSAQRTELAPIDIAAATTYLRRL